MYEEKHVELLLTGEGEKKHYVLINGFNRLMYDHYIMEENIFVVIVYTLSLQKKYQNFILKIALKLMLKRLRCLKKVNMLNSKILKERYHQSCFMQVLKVF